MHAISHDTTGGPEVLRWVELPDPVPGPGELLVRTRAVGVNFIDTYRRSGLYPVELPHVPGTEGAGLVEALGPGVAQAHPELTPGAEVAWADAPASYAELVLVPAERALPVPDGVGPDRAAAAALQGLTAHYLITDTAGVTAGTRCLVHAAAGGVGLLLVQLAAARGAEVFATAGSAQKRELARAAGAAHVVPYADGEDDFADLIERIAGPHPLDVVLDGVGRATVERGLDLLRPRGLMVTFGNASGAVEPISPLRLMRGGSLFLTRPHLDDYVRDREELLRRAAEVYGAVASGALDIRIGVRVPLAEAERAHRLLEGRATTGKVLLVP